MKKQDNLQIEYISIDELREYENNAKLHPLEQVSQIKTSIENFGFNDPIAVWKDNVIIEGHGRLIAARELGIDKVPIIRLDKLSDEERRAYMLVHNQLTMNTGFDDEALNMELDEISIDMEQYGFEITPVCEEIDVVEDESPEDVETRCKLGDLWQLGGHRLICGDSTDVAVIDRLMDGVKADMVFTDPPYGVDYKGINNDSRDGLSDLLDGAFGVAMANTKQGGAVYCFHSDKCADIFQACFRKFCHFSSTIIWKKKSLVLSQTDYQSIHEPCLYGWFDNGTHSFYGDRKQTSVWEFERESIDGHTTPKPIGFIANALRNSSKEKESVLDCFGGSGSTLIACEQLNRKCYMCELDPYYCDVIIQRWENFTGEKAVLLNG